MSSTHHHGRRRVGQLQSQRCGLKRRARRSSPEQLARRRAQAADVGGAHRPRSRPRSGSTKTPAGARRARRPRRAARRRPRSAGRRSCGPPARCAGCCGGRSRGAGPASRRPRTAGRCPLRSWTRSRATARLLSVSASSGFSAQRGLVGGDRLAGGAPARTAPRRASSGCRRRRGRARRRGARRRPRPPRRRSPAARWRARCGSSPPRARAARPSSAACARLLLAAELDQRDRAQPVAPLLLGAGGDGGVGGLQRAAWRRRAGAWRARSGSAAAGSPASAATAALRCSSASCGRLQVEQRERALDGRFRVASQQLVRPDVGQQVVVLAAVVGVEGVVVGDPEPGLASTGRSRTRPARAGAG